MSTNGCLSLSRSLESRLRLIAGTFVILSVMLTIFHSNWWLAFTLFIGLNLFQSGITDWCPMVWILEKLGYKRVSFVAEEQDNTPSCCCSK